MNAKQVLKEFVAREYPGEMVPHPCAILCIVNDIFRTRCIIPDAIDASVTWEIIIEELKPYKRSAQALLLRYQMGLTFFEIGKILGVSTTRAGQRIDAAMRKLRHPERVLRIRNSIVGWPNLYRDLDGLSINCQNNQINLQQESVRIHISKIKVKKPMVYNLEKKAKFMLHSC
jgi:hypothetical protein